MPRSRSRSRSRSTSPAPENQERGYKAALHNPRVSRPAKENAKRELEERFGERPEDYDPNASRSRPQSARPEYDTSGGSTSGSEDEMRSATEGAVGGKYGAEPVPSSRGNLRNKTNVVRGLKAATHNPNNTDHGRRQAAARLEDLGERPD